MSDNIWAAADRIFRKLGRMSFCVALFRQRWHHHYLVFGITEYSLIPWWYSLRICHLAIILILLSLYSFLFFLLLPSLFLYFALLLILIQRLARNLMMCITKQQQQQQECTAVNILENFTTENKYYWYTAHQNTQIIFLTP